MMGSSCSSHRQEQVDGDDPRSNAHASSLRRRNRASRTGRGGGSSRQRLRSRSFSNRVGRLCGGSEDESSDEEYRVKGPAKRSARHSVDAEVPDQSISHFYPIDDNYQPHPTDPTLRCPKSLTDLCIDTICRSLPNLDGELPPGLPQDMVDRIVKSLTSHGALNSTTLRILRNCELGELSLANCRGVSDEWLIPLLSSGSGSSNGSPVGKHMERGGVDSKKLMEQQQRPRCASAASAINNNDGCMGAPSSPPLKSVHRPTQFVLSPHHSSSFLEVRSSSSMMMDLDGNDGDCDCDGGEQYAYNAEIMEECCSKSFASGSTSSFVSARSTLNHPATQSFLDENNEGRPPSPLLPSVLPPPEFFSMKLQGTPSSLWLYPTRGGSYNQLESHVTATSQLLNQTHPLLLPSTSSLKADDTGKRDVCNDDMDYNEGVCNDSFIAPPSPTNAISSTLTLLDLRGSQRLTDRGLRQLSHRPLCSLEIVKLDNCHGITGRGLVAFSKSENLHTLSLANCRRLTDEAVVNISHLENLEALNLGGCRCLTDRSLEALSELVYLRKLDLSQCDLITDEGLANLYNLEFIEELSLGWCRQISHVGLSILAEQPNRSNALRVLCLARCPITDEGLDHLGTLESLEQLDLNGCVHISSLALGNTLEKLTNLTHLDVSYCPGILRSSWQGKINNLKSLELCYSGVQEVHLSHLTNLPMLEELNLDSCPDVGDWAVAHLADNNVTPNLTSLDLSDADISNRGLEKISQFKNLKRLSLFYCHISNAGLRHVASIPTLEVLNLDSRDIDDSGLRHLKSLPLKSLDLFSNRVTDLGCAHISKIKTLTSLELCGGGVSDLGCAHLANLINLTSLNLSQNEEITNRGAASLAALSNLKAVNLSKTRVNSGALKFFSGLVRLQSLALYGCKDVEDSPGLYSLQNELPSLRCLRLNSALDQDGVIDHVELDEDEDDHSEEESEVGNVEAAYQRSLLQHHHFFHHPTERDESSILNSDDSMSALEEFEDAHNDEFENLEESRSMSMDGDMEDEPVVSV